MNPKHARSFCVVRRPFSLLNTPLVIPTLLALVLACVGCRPSGSDSEQQDASALPALPAPSEPADHQQPDETRPAIDLPTEGTLRMAELLRSLAESTDPEKNPSMSRSARIEQLRTQIAGSSNPSNRVALQAHLAWQMMLEGQNEEAVDLFDDVLRNRGLVTDHQAAFNRNLFELAGLANLRLAEEQNCILNHGHESCIVPIQGSGIHRQPDAARKAMKLFSALYAATGRRDTRYRWLINIAYMALGEYPEKVPSSLLIPPSAFESDYDIGRFKDIAMQANVATVGLSGGAVVDDFNNDGLLDIMSSDWALDKQLRIYRNAGDGTFKQMTAQSGLDGEFGGLNLIHADFDNDGLIDVFVLRGAWLSKHGEFPNSLLRNLGNFQFDDVTEKAGLLSRCPTQTAVWADFDRDGFVDLFVGNESSKGQVYPCQLFHNNGDGTFTDIAESAGVAHVGFVKGVSSGDIDRDGRPDLFLSCFGQPNVMFRNTTADGTIQFNNVTSRAQVVEPKGSFPAWFWDYNNDGWDDLLVAPFSGFKFDGTAVATTVGEYLGIEADADRIHLYRNNKDGTFTNVAPELELDLALLVMGANFGDIDNDGFLDCYFGTGDPHFSTLVPNRMLRNDGGKRFQDVTTSGGFGHIQKGHGIAFGDVDSDGDEDIFAVMGGAISGDIYQNVLFQNPGHGNRWITLRLHGTRSNRMGIGAKIQVDVVDADGTPRQIFRTVNSGGSFGASSFQQEIGLGAAAKIKAIEVTWPSIDSTQTFTDVEMDRVYTLHEDDGIQ